MVALSIFTAIASTHGLTNKGATILMTYPSDRKAMTMSNTEHEFKDSNRHYVEVPDTFAIARWRRDADIVTICRCILGTLKYEPHTTDTTALRDALEDVIEHEFTRREIEKHKAQSK